MNGTGNSAPSENTLGNSGPDLLHPPVAGGNHGSLHSIMEEEQAPRSDLQDGENFDFLSILD